MDLFSLTFKNISRAFLGKWAIARTAVPTDPLLLPDTTLESNEETRDKTHKG